MNRLVIFLVVGVLIVGMATPVVANPDSSQVFSVGAFTGSAAVGKSFIGNCTNADQSGFPTGGGFGLPELKRNKTGWWKLVATVTTVPQGVGTTIFCGQLAPAFSVGKAPVGAACLASSGRAGFGRITAGALSKKLMDVGWVTSVGDVLPLTARTSEGVAKKPGGHFAALVWVTGALPCLDKAPDPKPNGGQGSGATTFTMAGVFGLVN